MHFVDVHTHLCHRRFDDDLDQVIKRAEARGIKYMISNGLNPRSNERVLALQQLYPSVKAALGIYPIDAACEFLPADSELKIVPFDVDAELQRIKEHAESGALIAIGECGLDGYWLGEESFSQQERVFNRLIEIAKDNDLPVIIHSRKREQRCFDIVAEHQWSKVNFHCYGGKVKTALKMAETYGWCFSIPANARKNESFTKLLKDLPKDCILTETDAPYLAPIRGERNEPMHVTDTISYLAELRSLDAEQAQQLVYTNFCRLFLKS